MKIKETIGIGLILFLGFLLLQGSVMQNESKIEMPINALSAKVESDTYYKRINLVVRDIDKSMTIYRDILGFTTNSISESGPDSYSYPVFKIPKEAKIRFTTLDGPKQERTMALTEVSGVDIPTPTNAPHMSASVIQVSDLPNVIEKIQSLGLETTKVKEVYDEKRDFRFLEQAFVDFDGHLIVIYEVL